MDMDKEKYLKTKFFPILFGDFIDKEEVFLEIRYLKPGKDRRGRTSRGFKRQVFFNLKKELPEIKPYETNIYFGVGVRKNNSSGEKTNVGAFSFLYVDIDYKNVDKTKIKEQIQRPPLPTIGVESGEGAHLYFKLKKPFVINKFEDMEYFEALVRGLTKRFDGDLGAVDGARILRVPFTFNFKYNPPKEVNILCENFNAVYDIKDFEDTIAYKPKKREKVRGQEENRSHNFTRWRESLMQSVKPLLERMIFLKQFLKKINAIKRKILQKKEEPMPMKYPNKQDIKPFSFEDIGEGLVKKSTQKYIQTYYPHKRLDRSARDYKYTCDLLRLGLMPYIILGLALNIHYDFFKKFSDRKNSIELIIAAIETAKKDVGREAEKTYGELMNFVRETINEKLGERTRSSILYKNYVTYMKEKKLSESIIPMEKLSPILEKNLGFTKRKIRGKIYFINILCYRTEK